MLLTSAIRKMKKACNISGKEAREFIEKHGEIYEYDTLIVPNKKSETKCVCNEEVIELIKMYKTLQEIGEK